MAEVSTDSFVVVPHQLHALALKIPHLQYMCERSHHTMCLPGAIPSSAHVPAAATIHVPAGGPSAAAGLLL